MKSREELENLKRNWKQDPCYDIEDTEGFEEYREELLAFSKEQQAIWEKQREEHHKRLTDKLCPMCFSNSGEDADYHCVAEKCAWWIGSEEKCAMVVIPNYKAIEIARLER